MKTVAPSSKFLLATARVWVNSPHKCHFVTIRALLDQGSTLSSNHLLNAYAFRELIAPFPLPALAKCNPSCITLPKLWLFRRFATDLPILRSRFILQSLTKYLPNRINTAYHWKHVIELELADRDRAKYDSRLDSFQTKPRSRLSQFPQLRITEWRNYSWNSRSRSSSLLGDWGNASESSSEPWGAAVRRALQNHAFLYTERMLYYSLLYCIS